jgi:hypothetical protein
VTTTPRANLERLRPGNRQPSGIRQQDREAAVRPEVSVERDGLPNAKPLHDDEAQGIAERVRFVLVRAQEGDGPILVALPNPFDVVGVIAHHVEEGQGAPPAAP